MDKDVNIEGSLLINGKPGKPGETVVSRGAEKTPAWSSFSKSLEKSNKSTPPSEKESSTAGKLAGAAKDEITSRITGVLSQAFPLLTAAPYIRALKSLPGVDLTTSIIQKSGILDKKEQAQRQDQEQESNTLEQESFSILESILNEVAEIRKVIAGPLLKEGYMFEEPKGKGAGGFKSLKTGRYVKEEEATAEPVARGKMGAVGSAKKGIGAAKKGLGLAKDVASGKAVDVVKAGAGRLATGVATAGRAAVGVAAGGLKLGAILTALAMFLPKDMKSVIGSIFEGLLEGLGFEKDTIQAIFTPFRILSDIAEIIKKVIGLAWDFVKWIFKSLGNIVDWFSSRGKANAAEEVSKATGGTGHGEFTTGGEGPAASVPIPETEPPPKAAGAPTAPPSAPPTATPTAPTAAPAAATPIPTTPSAPLAPAPAAVPAMVPPITLDKDVSEYLNKPENAVDKQQFDEANARIATFKNAINVAKDSIDKETDPDKRKNYEFILKRQLEPGLRATEQQRDMIIEKAKQAAGTAAGTPAAPAPPVTPLMGAIETGSESAGVAGDTGGGAETGGAGGGGGGGGGSSPAAQLESPEPTTGQQIDKESVGVEAARDEMPASVSSEVIENGEIAAGSVMEDSDKVPSPIASRSDLDADIFFSAVA